MNKSANHSSRPTNEGFIGRFSGYSAGREKSVRATAESHPTVRVHPGRLLLAIPVDPHARKFPVDRELVHGSVLYWSFAFVVVVSNSTRHPTVTSGVAWSTANRVYPEARDVREKRAATLERGRQRDPVVTGADGDVPVEATGKGDVDVAVVGEHLYVESWTGPAVSIRGRRVMLSFFFRILFQNNDLQKNRRKNVLISRGLGHFPCTDPGRLDFPPHSHRG